MSRVLTTGFEFSNIADNELLSVGSEVSISTTSPRTTAGGNGGLRVLEANTSGSNSIIFQATGYDISESYSRMYLRFESFPTTHEIIFYNTTAAAEVFKIRFTSAGNGPYTLNVNGVDQTPGTNQFFGSTYYKIGIYALISASGNIQVDIDGVTDINFSGATNGAAAGWDQIRINTDGYILFDDFAINDTYTRVNYTSGSGTAPSVGATISGGASSGTLIKHVGDGVDGYLIIDNSGATFADAVLIGDGGAFTATTNGAEDSSSTGAVPEGYVQLFFPDGNGTTSQLTNSNETSTDNYTYVDDFEGTSDYVYTETDNQKDTYSMENLPAEAVSINHVDVCFYSKRDGSLISNIQNSFVINSTDYDSHQESLTGTFRWNKFSYQENPDTQTQWTESDLNNLEAGPKLRS